MRGFLGLGCGLVVGLSGLFLCLRLVGWFVFLVGWWRFAVGAITAAFGFVWGWYNIDSS